MIKNNYAPLFLLLILLCSCRTINRNREELNIPPSVIYFSFDDGPNVRDDTTARLLDVLKKHQIKAMFCLLGVNAEQSPDLVRRIYDEGHCLVNHGYSDKWASRMNPDEFRNNLIRGGRQFPRLWGAIGIQSCTGPMGVFILPRRKKSSVRKAIFWFRAISGRMTRFLTGQNRIKL